MAYDPGALEAALAAAVGEEPVLIAELRRSFFASADGHLAVLRAAESDLAWQNALERLKGLAASFGALRVLDAAHAALACPHGEMPAIARIERALAALAHAAD